MGLCGEILSALNWMFPFDKETKRCLGSQASLRCMVWFLDNHGTTDLSTMQNSILVLEELVSCSKEDHNKHVEELANIDGVEEILVGFVRKQVCPTMTKSSLMLIYYLVSSSYSERLARLPPAFAKMGLVSLLVDILVNHSEKSTSEKALGVVDELCDCREGREQAYENALTVPILVKKLLRVSDLATGFSVSTILKLCKFASSEEGEGKGEKAVVEALQVGVFQKLLVILQVGCGHETKEKVTELLKLLNPYRAGLECIESVDFKNLKRSF